MFCALEIKINTKEKVGDHYKSLERKIYKIHEAITPEIWGENTKVIAT